jgi:hypothetical protein
MLLVDAMIEKLENFVDDRIEAVKNSRVPPVEGEPLAKAAPLSGGDKNLGRRGLMFDPLTDSGLASGLFRPKGAGSGFISNHILKIVTRRDPIVSTIIHTRANQVAGFCKLPNDRFDIGFQLKVKHPDSQPDPDEIRMMEKYVLNCGETENRDPEDKLTFDAFGYMTSSDFLAYGHTAIENVKRGDGGLFAFLPLPAETIYHANRSPLGQQAAESMIAATRGAIDALLQRNGEDTDKGPNAEIENEDGRLGYVQVINGKIVEGFGFDDITFARIYTQADIDLQGYALGPLERAVSMVTAHLQIENHQKMFFTHGVASKGLLVIQGDVTPNQLRTLQAQWTNQVTGPQSAWRTPILAGIRGVQWQPFMTGSRDMEYAAYQDHVLRTMHACFAIDPEETGFGYLSKGTEQRSLGESSNEWKIEASRDRGLRPLLARLESILNEDLLPKWNPILADKYQFTFVGLDAETRGEEIERLKEEVQLHTTLNEAREEAELEPMKYGGDMILNPLLLQVIQANLPKGVFMETFMGVQGASERPDLQYIPDPLWFQWQQLQMQIMQMQAGVQQGQPGDEDDEDDDGDDSKGGKDKGDSKGKPPSKDSKKPGKPGKKKADKDGDDGEDDAEADALAEAQQQAQMQAVNQFVSANPELFKAMKFNLAKSDLAKGLIKDHRTDDSHVGKLADQLCDDFDHAGDELVKEIMAAVSEELKANAGSKPKG